MSNLLDIDMMKLYTYIFSFIFKEALFNSALIFFLFLWLFYDENNNDDSDSEYESDEYFGDEDSEDKKQEEVVDDLFNNMFINSITISFL